MTSKSSPGVSFTTTESLGAIPETDDLKAVKDSGDRAPTELRRRLVTMHCDVVDMADESRVEQPCARDVSIMKNICKKRSQSVTLGKQFTEDSGPGHVGQHGAHC